MTAATSPKVPRRWRDQLDGIAWLPRLIDKARMADAGTLGNYLFGHSPFDRALLERLGVTTEQFASIVRSSVSDIDVLRALRARGFDEARVRRWSDRLPRTARFYTYLWDLDDGYVQPNRLLTACVRVWRVTLERPVMALLRLVLKAP